LPALFFAASGHDDESAFLYKDLGNTLADPTCRARYDGDLVLKHAHDETPPLNRKQRGTLPVDYY
jgi:hypothetical protein